MHLILTDENFEQELRKSDKPVLVDFFATWCEPCSVLGPIIESAAKYLEGKIVLSKCNVDEIPMTANRFSIDRIPTVILFNKGEPVDSFIGLMPEPAIKEWVENALKKMQGNSSPEDVQQAKDDFKKKSQEYAEDSGFNLNPDEKTVERVINGLFENEKKHGKKYCPCRRVTGDPAEDEKKICPCYWHKDEVSKDGHCFCKLFVK